MELKIRDILLLMLSVLVFLSGCNLKLKTKEIQNDRYDSIGNEMELYGFGVGESIHTIEEVLDSKYKKGKKIFTFPEHELSVYIEHNISKILITKNENFNILEEIQVGMSKEELLEGFGDLELFEYWSESNQKSYIYFREKNQKVVLELSDEIITAVSLSNPDIPFEQVIYNNKVFENPDDLQDDEMISKSELLTFKIDFRENKKRALAPGFIDYAKVGLVEGIPVPIGMNKDELINRFGPPNYVFDGQSDISMYYFYERFNVYMGLNEDEELVEIKIPLSVPVNTFEETHKLDVDLDNWQIGKEYILTLIKENDKISEISLSKK